MRKGGPKRGPRRSLSAALGILLGPPPPKKKPKLVLLRCNLQSAPSEDVQTEPFRAMPWDKVVNGVWPASTPIDGLHPPQLRATLTADASLLEDTAAGKRAGRQWDCCSISCWPKGICTRPFPNVVPDLIAPSKPKNQPRIQYAARKVLQTGGAILTASGITRRI